MFVWADRAGYATAMIGNYLPYADIYSDSLDEGRSWDLYKVMGRGILAVATSMLLENMQIRLGAFIPPAERLFFKVKNVYFLKLAERINRIAEEHAADMAGKFVFIHHSVPHMPLIFDKNGLTGDVARRPQLNVDAYLGNLRYTDTLIGRLAAKFDHENTLWVFTSDHSFRFDPEHKGDDSPTSANLHVPLFVHLPGQTARHEIDTISS